MNKKRMYKVICAHVASQLRSSPVKEELLKNKHIDWKRTFYDIENKEISLYTLLAEVDLGKYVTLLRCIPYHSTMALEIDILRDGLPETLIFRKEPKDRLKLSSCSKKTKLGVRRGFRHKTIILLMALVSVLGLIPFVSVAVALVLVSVAIAFWVHDI